jgi:hypothetical protein
MSDLKAILQELVDLDDLRAEILRRKQRRLYSIKRNPFEINEVNKLEENYNLRKPIAWHKARQALTSLFMD